MFRFFAKKIYVLPDVTGKVAWVDYIPVRESSGAGRRDSWDTNGSLDVTEILTSITGLTQWVDYTPVYAAGSTAWFDHILLDSLTTTAPKLLMETGDVLLMETGDKLLLEGV